MSPSTATAARVASMLVRVLLLAAIPVALRAGDPAAVVLLALSILATGVARLAPPGAELAFVAGLATCILASATKVLPDRIGGDLLQHAVASGLLAMTLLLGPLARCTATRRFHISATIAAVLTVGLAWEAAEAYSDAHLATNMSLGPWDTTTDVLADLAGATGATLWLLRTPRSAAGRA